MENSDGIPGRDGSDDDPFNVVLDEEFVRSARIKEADLHPREGGARAARGRLRARVGIALMVLAAAGLAATAFVALGPSPGKPGRPAGSSPSAPAGHASASATASASASASDRPAVPLDAAFPAEVTGASGAHYTRVAAKVLASCTEADSVGPRLISMIGAGKGCVGEQVALYKDARNDQYNLAVFTMRDPADTVRLVTELSSAFDDHQVGAQAPPPGSGLPTPAAGSGLVQAFTGSGRAMVVGLGQWSDGRRSDYQELVDSLSPLLKGVTDKVTAYEGRG
ncbi:hypothetical protein [Kitasatospora sp. NPDC059571]|uniref:hypothetical protein n=1 Tax=Kitasatospora sp. NPDC059571 TaxID=3346871 RepID=UPI003690BE27